MIRNVWNRAVGLFFLLYVLCVPNSLGQTNVAAPPTFHFVAGGSAIGFNSGSGSQAGSIAYTGIQVTTDVAVTYEHITVGSLNASGNLAVASYTRPLNALLGKTVSSKLLFDASNINVTFGAGAGRWTTAKSNIAETISASISYP